MRAVKITPEAKMLSTNVLALIGAVTSINILWRLFVFVRHFLRPSALPRYLHGEAWALVTGASDGIGAGLVDELANRGFNVVLHGRNQAKLEGCMKRLKDKYPRRQFTTAVLDAKTATPRQIEDMAAQLPKTLTVLINNVGTSGDEKMLSRFLDRSVAGVGRINSVNEGFPDMLTRATLPNLISNQPSLIINIGSILGEWPCPFLEEYTGGKAHNKAFSHSLRATMVLEGYDVEVMHVRVASVATPGSGEPPSFGTVTPSTFARGALDRVGCGEGETMGCFRHGVMVGLPEFLIPNAKKVLGGVSQAMVKQKIEKC